VMNVTLTGDRELVVRLNAMGPVVQEALLKDVTRLSVVLQGVVLGKLHGPVLNQRSGALAGSIQRKVEQSGAAVFGYVYSSGDVKYAAFWEFGFKGNENVRAHTRQASMVFGRSVAPFTQNVSEHSRKVDQPARSFLRSSLADMSEQIKTDLIAAVGNAVRSQVMGG
jgi:hypothetical protein